ncbi:MAG: glycosyltransferase family 4 protein [Planctomycetota bacterium]
MRITFVMPPVGMSGGIRVIAEYAQRLRDRGHCVTVVAQGAKQKRMRDRVRGAVTGKGWRIPARRPSHFDGRDEGLKVLSSHRPVRASDVPDADVVVATWWETARWVDAMPASKGAKAYLLQHDESGLPNQPADEVRATWSLPLHRIAVSQWIADRVTDAAGGAVAVVPNSVDLDLFQAPPRGKQPVTTVGLMLVGQPWKGADVAAKAIAIARQRLGALRVVAFGPHDIRDRIGVGEEADVTFVQSPTQQELPKLYARCDAWLFASRFEGFGLPLLESMACRTPVIGVPAGAAPELIAPGGGVLVRPEHPESMADAIVQIAESEASQWRAMSDAAYATAAAYNWGDAAKRLEQELCHAVNGGGPEMTMRTEGKTATP